MKKILLCAFIFFPTIALSYSLDNLEEVIQASDFNLFKRIFTELHLTEHDKYCLLSLSHDVLCQRKSDIGTNNIQPKISSSKGFDLGGKTALTGLLIGVASGVVLGFCVNLDLCKYRVFYDEKLEDLCFLSLLAGIGMVVTGFFISVRDNCNMLQYKYDNALKIKQFILRARESNDFILTA